MTTNEMELKDLADDLVRTMRLTTNARFEGAKRLKKISSICFIATTIASLGLILIPLLDIAHQNKVFTTETLTSFQIFLAVSVLVYSTAVATADYGVRSKEFLECADKIKVIVKKLKLEIATGRLLSEPDMLRRFDLEYMEALEGTENHEDIDHIKALELYNKKMKKVPRDFWTLENIKNLLPKEVKMKAINVIKIYGAFIILLTLEGFFITDMIGATEILDKLHKPKDSLTQTSQTNNKKIDKTTSLPNS